MLSRRDLIGKLAAGTAAVWAVGAARSGSAAIRREANTSTGSDAGEGQLAAAPSVPANAPDVVDPLPRVVDADPPASTRLVDSGPPTTLNASPPWKLVRPLAMGSAVAHGWRVSGLTGAVNGSCVLTLQNQRGREHRVHICRNDGHPHGLIYTERFDLVVMNGGVGDLPTEEGLAQAVAAVAHVLAANEGRQRHEPVVTALLPHTERLRLFAGAMDRSLR